MKLNSLNLKVKDDNLLNFYLSSVTIPNFKYEPNAKTKKSIWEYMNAANLISIEDNPIYNTDTSQKFIDWSKIPKVLFLPIPPMPLILIVFMFIHGNSSARAIIISLSILSLLFLLLLFNWAKGLR